MKFYFKRTIQLFYANKNVIQTLKTIYPFKLEILLP